MTFIPYGKQSINEHDIQAVIAVLKSDLLTQGPSVERFEKAVAEYCGAKYAVAVANGTAALHLACLAAGLGKDDVFWTSPNTFVASANCGLYCGAKPDFVDIDFTTYNMSADHLHANLIKAQGKGILPKIIIPVHFAGQSCDMERIHALSQQYGFVLIEDACHAIGGSYKGRKIGSCASSDMTVFSFHPVKIITTGEGGMIVTNNEAFYQKLLLLRTHGITKDPRFMEGESEGAWYYQQTDLGMNYRITDIQAALGLSQLQRIDQFVTRRQQLAIRYDRLLEGLPLVTPMRHPDSYSTFHLYVVQLELDKIAKKRRTIFDELRNSGIGVHVHYIPVHTQLYYQKLGFNKGDFPVAEQYYERALTLPLYFDMTEAEQDRIVDALKKAIE